MRMANTDLIKKWEGLRLEAYLPTPNDVWTIGWGHTLGVKKGDKITKEQAEAFFREDIKWAEEAVNSSVNVTISQNMFDALVSLTFNIGATAFKKSTLLKKLNKGDYEGAADQFLVWNKQKGKILSGLSKRRSEEREYFLRTVSTSGPSSATVDTPEKPSILKDVPSLVGAGGVLTALGSLASSAQIIAVVALVALGAYLIWNSRKDK